MGKLRNVNRKLYPSRLFYAPQWLVLGVNNICNLHCKMCDVGTQNLETNFATNLVGTHPLHMPVELFERIVDQTKKYYPTTKLGYAFTEPLVYKHLEETLAYAKRAELFTSITTNALNLRQKSDILAKNGLGELYISLDGPQDIHNDIRGHKSSFQRALEGIEALKSKSDIPISVYCVITEWNIGYLEQFLNELSELPLKHVGLMHSNFITKEVAEQHNARFGDEYHATFSNVEEVNFEAFNLELLGEELRSIASKKFSFSTSLHPNVASKEELHRYYFEPQKRVGQGCYDVFNNIMIKSDGSVIPAHGRCFNVPVGNLYQKSLKEIWNSTEIQRLRKLLIKEKGLLPACNRCCSAV
ncbi:MAG: radical SAM protein [bacterium]|nr:radical SAM protein [bacterium]